MNEGLSDFYEKKKKTHKMSITKFLGLVFTHTCTHTCNQTFKHAWKQFLRLFAHKTEQILVLFYLELKCRGLSTRETLVGVKFYIVKRNFISFLLCARGGAFSTRISIACTYGSSGHIKSHLRQGGCAPAPGFKVHSPRKFSPTIFLCGSRFRFV